MRRTLFFTFVCASFLCIFSACNPYADRKFTSLFNGENLDGWYCKIRSANDSLAQKVFAVEDGMVHVFNDAFPDKYELKGKNNTHGLFYTNKKYSRFIFRFDYKWGKKIANNYHQFQYDAGCYYHVVDDKVWPIGVEYQVRYNDVTNENHTGDFWTGQLSKQMIWTADAEGKHFLSVAEGGVPQSGRTGELRASKNAPFNGLNDQWNECEVIVMGDKYAIHKLNGELVNVGIDLGISSGNIGLQSETGEIFYRNIRILELDEDVPMEDFL